MPRLTATDVSVDFTVRHLSSNSLRSVMRSIAPGGRLQRRRDMITVRGLRNVSFTFEHGDRVGILGVNGAGKTTLLRVLAGLLPPTRGDVTAEGRISPLLSIQLGFDENLDGFGNIRLRARLMGHSDAEIDEQFDDIVAFTELGEHLHFPFRTFSSGMRLRLAFAVATAFSPDILLLDEWISAGDARFKDAAAVRLNGLIESAGIFAFASHTLSLHKRLCNKGLVLDTGQAVFFGPIEDAMKHHAELMAAAR